MHMKRLPCFLIACLLALTCVPAAADEPFHFESEALGFSMTVPGLSAREVVVEESTTGVQLFHAPSREKWGGLIGSIEVVAPRSGFFSGGYDSAPYQILAMGKDRVFLWKSPGGGVNTGGAQLESFEKAAAALSTDKLKACLIPAHPDAQPLLSQKRHLPYLAVENGHIRPDTSLTRGELADMLYALLDADNKGGAYEAPFSDVTGTARAQAVGYLASYGILTGYPDGTFRPNAPISRAAFAVLLHRCQFAAPVGRYGDAPDFADVPVGYWAEEAVYSASILGWMTGTADGLFRPGREITRSEAVTAVNRMLGRDESHTTADAASPFSDLKPGHWAYQNVLEAAGALPGDFARDFTVKTDALPKGTGAYAFIDAENGWAVSAGQLRRTVDGGKTWSAVGAPLSPAVSGLFFFNSQEGVLLGSDEDCACILLQTADGGRTWVNFLADADARVAHLPARQFANERSLLASIVSAELRPAGQNAVYLTVRYQPYESIYACDFEAVRQTAITGAELHAAK